MLLFFLMVLYGVHPVWVVLVCFVHVPVEMQRGGVLSCSFSLHPFSQDELVFVSVLSKLQKQ